MNENSAGPSNQTRVTRRDFVRTAPIATLASALDGVAAGKAGAATDLRKELSPTVQMQFMRPAYHSEERRPSHRGRGFRRRHRQCGW